MIRLPTLLRLLPTFAVAAYAQAAPVDEGQALYNTECAACHGRDLSGGRASALLTEQWTDGSQRAELFTLIHEGAPEQGMPSFRDSLSGAQIHRVIDYMTSLTPASEGAHPPPVPGPLDTLDYQVAVSIFADDLVTPWAIDFIDSDTALITERLGQLRQVRAGRLLPEPVAGTPEMSPALREQPHVQGGLLDVAVDPQHADNGWVYLAYSHVLEELSEEGRARSMVRLVRGRIRNNQWLDEQVVFEAPHATYVDTLPYHYGSRIVFDADGYLYLAIGDRYASEQAQDLSRPNGKIHRLHPDGRVPADNPFVEQDGALPSIFTYGHRNPQGLAVHPQTGEIWAAEHGPRGGDELNRLVAGANYGWPNITYGINYDGSEITPNRQAPDMAQPTLYWRPSIAVSGLDFYSGDRFSLWRNKLLTGALKDEEVRLLDIVDGRVIHQEVILKGAGQVREAVTGPDGAIYVVLNHPDRVLRLTPLEERKR